MDCLNAKTELDWLKGKFDIQQIDEVHGDIMLSRYYAFSKRLQTISYVNRMYLSHRRPSCPVGQAVHNTSPC